MPIIYHQSSKTFHLYNQDISYIFKILPSHDLGQLYYGKRVHDKENFDYLLELSHRPMSPCYFEGDLTYSKEHLKQEFPVFNTGDFKQAAIDIIQKNGSRILELEYDHFKIINGKEKLNDLPATYTNDKQEATTLKIYLIDRLLNIEVILSYTIFEYLPVIARNVWICNKGNESIQLDALMSLSLDLPDYQYQMIELSGAWARERHIKERPLCEGMQSIASLRGHSSHHFNPFMALKRKNCDEYNGEVIGFSFVYSGNFLMSVEVDTYHVSRVQVGIHPVSFSYTLHQDESFQSPEALLVYSHQGLNHLSQNFHQLFNQHLIRGAYKNQVRPILVNNWEGTYFDFNEEKLINMASLAKELGIELFVLDDGWFGKRNDDTTSLGDWFVNIEKLPHGIGYLANQIHQLGLKFGLWFESEMINIKSQLYLNHPDWVLKTPNRHLSHGRNQYVLDFSNPDVVQYIENMMVVIIEEGQLDYIKWDMNRSMSEVYSNYQKEQGKVYHEYILGVYRLYEHLTKKYPHILFESCASGGGRFDPGMLYYASQTWTSDNTDAIERLKIQYGTSLVYPISSMGSHVSAIPNHQLKRHVSLDTRANVAYFGTFGYELDILKLNDAEKEIIKKQIVFMKEYRHIFQFGQFYRLINPFEGNETMWMVVNDNQSLAIVGYYRTLQEVNVGYRRVPLLGLNPNKLYQINNKEYYGDELMNIGLIISDESSGENHSDFGDYRSQLYIIKEK